MNLSEFTFLFISKKIVVFFLNEKMYAVYADNEEKVFELKPEWYIIALDTFKKRKWN